MEGDLRFCPWRVVYNDSVIEKWKSVLIAPQNLGRELQLYTMCRSCVFYARNF